MNVFIFDLMISIYFGFVPLTSGLSGDGLLQGNVVNADPHLCAPLFKLTPGQFALTEG